MTSTPGSSPALAGASVLRWAGAALLAAVPFAVGYYTGTSRSTRDWQLLDAGLRTAGGWTSFQADMELSLSAGILFNATGTVYSEPLQTHYKVLLLPEYDRITFQLATGPDGTRSNLFASADTRWDTVEQNPLLNYLAPLRDPLHFWREAVAHPLAVVRLETADGSPAFQVTPDWAGMDSILPVDLAGVESGTVTLRFEKGSLWLREAEAELRFRDEELRLSLKLSNVNLAGMLPKK